MRTWILGASDPEMEEIEKLLKSAGERVLYAALDGRRVDAGTAYKANVVVDGQGIPVAFPNGEVFLVECFDRPVDAAATIRRIDHHRVGDPGYGQPPENYWPASSLGQVAGALGLGMDLTGQTHYKYVAAADHCLAAAYRGRCPGVSPDDLMAWRVASRARFQGRLVEDVLRDVEAAREALRSAPKVALVGGSSPVADLRGREIPELPEAAAREGIAFLGTPRPGKDGRRKIVLQAASPEQVRAFLESWAPAQGLRELYGDPARGLAGGYGA